MEEVKLPREDSNKLQGWDLHQVAIYKGRAYIKYRCIWTRIRRVEMWFLVFGIET